MNRFTFFIILSALILSCFTISAQDLQQPNFGFSTQCPGPSDNLKNGNQRDGKFIIDSTWFYLADTFGQSWFNNERYKVTERDAWGNFLNATTFQFDTITNLWFANQTYEATYSDSVTTSFWSAHVWDSHAVKWRMSDSISYNPEGVPTISWYKAWDPFKYRFSRGQRVVYSYQSDDLETRYVQKFDTLTGNWKHDKKYAYSYNVDGLLENELIMEWDDASSSYKEYLFIGYSYNDDQLIESEITQLWGQGNQWEDSLKIEYGYYEGNNKLKQKSRLLWDGYVGWEDFNRILYSYDENLRTEEALTQMWDDFGNEWFNSSIILYEYNSQGLRSEVLYRFWDTYGYWIDLSKYLYSYDDDGNRTEFLYKTWDYENNEWLNFYKDINYWSEFVPIGLNEISNVGVQLYPNPTNGRINLAFDKNIKNGLATVFSMDGKLLLNKKIQGNEPHFNLGALPQGKYILTINIKGEIFSQIVIKN